MFRSSKSKSAKSSKLSDVSKKGTGTLQKDLNWVASTTFYEYELLQFQVAREGPMCKRGKISKGWKKRYFVLCPPGCIFYFKDEEGAKRFKNLRINNAENKRFSRKGLEVWRTIADRAAELALGSCPLTDMEHPEVWTGPEELRMMGHFRGEDNCMTVKISHTDIHRRFYFSAAHPQTLKNWVKAMEEIHEKSEGLIAEREERHENARRKKRAKERRKNESVQRQNDGRILEFCRKNCDLAQRQVANFSDSSDPDKLQPVLDTVRDLLQKHKRSLRATEEGRHFLSEQLEWCSEKDDRFQDTSAEFSFDGFKARVDNIKTALENAVKGARTHDIPKLVARIESILSHYEEELEESEKTRNFVEAIKLFITDITLIYTYAKYEEQAKEQLICAQEELRRVEALLGDKSIDEARECWGLVEFVAELEPLVSSKFADSFFDEYDQLHLALREQIHDYVEGQSLAFRPTGECEKRLRELETQFGESGGGESKTNGFADGDPSSPTLASHTVVSEYSTSVGSSQAAGGKAAAAASKTSQSSTNADPNDELKRSKLKRELEEMKYSLEDALSSQDKEGIAMFTEMIIATLDENDAVLTPQFLSEMDEYMEDADQRGATVYLADALESIDRIREIMNDLHQQLDKNFAVDRIRKAWSDLSFEAEPVLEESEKFAEIEPVANFLQEFRELEEVVNKRVRSESIESTAKQIDAICAACQDSLNRSDLESMVEHGERLRRQLQSMEDRFGDDELAKGYVEKFRGVLEQVLAKVDEVLPPGSDAEEFDSDSGEDENSDDFSDVDDNVNGESEGAAEVHHAEAEAATEEAMPASASASEDEEEVGKEEVKEVVKDEPRPGEEKVVMAEEEPARAPESTGEAAPTKDSATADEKNVEEVTKTSEPLLRPASPSIDPASDSSDEDERDADEVGSVSSGDRLSARGSLLFTDSPKGSPLLASSPHPPSLKQRLSLAQEPTLPPAIQRARELSLTSGNSLRRSSLRSNRSARDTGSNQSTPRQQVRNSLTSSTARNSLTSSATRARSPSEQSTLSDQSMRSMSSISMVSSSSPKHDRRRKKPLSEDENKDAKSSTSSSSSAASLAVSTSLTDEESRRIAKLASNLARIVKRKDIKKGAAVKRSLEKHLTPYRAAHTAANAAATTDAEKQQVAAQHELIAKGDAILVKFTDTHVQFLARKLKVALTQLLLALDYDDVEAAKIAKTKLEKCAKPLKPFDGTNRKVTKLIRQSQEQLNSFDEDIAEIENREDDEDDTDISTDEDADELIQA